MNEKDKDKKMRHRKISHKMLRDNNFLTKIIEKIIETWKRSKNALINYLRKK